LTDGLCRSLYVQKRGIPPPAAVWSRLLLRDREDLGRLSRKGLWSPSYLAVCNRGKPIETIQAHMRNQRTPAA